MSLLVGLRKDVSWKFMGEVLSRLVFLIFFFYVGRKLQVADFGVLNLALSTAFILGVLFLDPGLCIATIQSMIGDEASRGRVAGAVLSLKLLLGIPFVVSLVVVAAFCGTRLPSLSLLLLAALYTFSNNILEYLSAVTNAYHRMDIEGLLKILNRVTIVLFGAVAITTAKPAPLLWAMFLANAICCAVLWILVKRYCVSVRPLWDGEVAKRVLILGLPVAGTLIVSAVYLKWDLLILSSYSIAPEQLGWYAAAFKIVEALSAIPSILGAALFPTLVQLRHSDPGKLDRLLSMTTKAMLLVSIPVAAIISALSEILIYRVYGSAYLPGARVLAVLIWCIVPMFVYYYLIFVNVASGKAAYNLIAGCLALVAGLITNMILIPRIGYTGAAWAALAANACFALIASWKVSRTFPNAGIQKLLLKMSVVTLGMAGPIWLMPAALPIRVAAGCLSYAGVVVLLRGITQEEVRFALRIVQLRPAVEGAGG